MSSRADAATTAGDIPPHGGAYVTTLPLGAAVWVDGTYFGSTPLYAELPPGHHGIAITSRGWAPLSADFDVAVGRTAALSFLLQPASASKGTSAASPDAGGSLTVRGGTAGVAISIDAVRSGELPLERRSLATGHHIVIVGNDRRHRLMRDVVIYPNTVTVLPLNLAAPQSGSGRSGMDVLAPLKWYVPAADVSTSGQQLIIHTRGVELSCEIGSHTYVLNGRAQYTDVTPAMLGGKVYLPLSLLKRIKG